MIDKLVHYSLGGYRHYLILIVAPFLIWGFYIKIDSIIEASQITYVDVFGILVLSSFTYISTLLPFISFRSEKKKWMKCRFEDSIEKYKDLVPKICTVKGICQFRRNPYHLYFQCAGKMYCVAIGTSGKDLTENEKRMLRSHTFQIDINALRNVSVFPLGKDAYEPRSSYHPIFCEGMGGGIFEEIIPKV